MKEIEGMTGITMIPEVLYKDNPGIIVSHLLNLVNEMREKESLPRIEWAASLHQTEEAGIAVRIKVPGYRKPIGPENEKESS